MSTVRIALANVSVPSTPEESVDLATAAIAEAARRGASVVEHVSREGDLCRAAENTCYVASVNCASDGVGITSAIARPDGTVLCYQPYGQAGLLVADLDLSAATGLLATRCRVSAL